MVKVHVTLHILSFLYHKNSYEQTIIRSNKTVIRYDLESNIKKNRVKVFTFRQVVLVKKIIYFHFLGMMLNGINIFRSSFYSDVHCTQTPTILNCLFTNLSINVFDCKLKKTFGK